MYVVYDEFKGKEYTCVEVCASWFWHQLSFAVLLLDRPTFYEYKIIDNFRKQYAKQNGWPMNTEQQQQHDTEGNNRKRKIDYISKQTKIYIQNWKKWRP